VRKYLILGGIILLAGIVINYSLDGFKKIEPALVSAPATTIYGSLYEGGHSSDALETQVLQLRKILNESGQPGTLTIVNYNQSDLEKRGMIKQFLGIEWTQNGKSLGQFQDSLFIAGYNGFQFRIPIKPLVMPSPEKLKKLAKDATLAMAGELQGFSIEQYKDGFLIINFPLK
jgi:hypothetical protein